MKSRFPIVRLNLESTPPKRGRLLSHWRTLAGIPNDKVASEKASFILLEDGRRPAIFPAITSRNVALLLSSNPRGSSACFTRSSLPSSPQPPAFKIPSQTRRSRRYCDEITAPSSCETLMARNQRRRDANPLGPSQFLLRIF